MELLYFKVDGGNFGDDLNNWLWDRLIPGWREWPRDAVLVGVGTILKRGFLPEGRPKLVLGSGLGYSTVPDLTANPQEWDVRAVRGPITAAALGLPAEKGIVDPAMLIPDLAEFSDIARGDEIVFIPHHASDYTFDWRSICKGTGITYVSPAGEAHEVIRAIAGARCVIAESMHGAIIADAFRVPWYPVSINRTFNHMKWRDWGDSVNVDVTPQPFFPLLRTAQALVRKVRGTRKSAPKAPSSTTPAPSSLASTPGSGGWKYRLAAGKARSMLKRVAKRPFRLSSDAVLEARKATFRSMLEGVKRDYGG